MLTDLPVIVTVAAMLPAAVTGALIGTALHRRDARHAGTVPQGDTEREEH